MAKLKQKISGGFSEQGANDFATIRGFISTAKKQGWNIIPALMENPETLIARLRDAPRPTWAVTPQPIAAACRTIRMRASLCCAQALGRSNHDTGIGNRAHAEALVALRRRLDNLYDLMDEAGLDAVFLTSVHNVVYYLGSTARPTAACIPRSFRAMANPP